LCRILARVTIGSMEHPAFELKAAASVEPPDYIRGLNRAYADYRVPIHLNGASFRELVAREDIRLESSLAALDGSQVIGLGMLGARGQRGWIGGMGVIPERRREGIGRAILSGLLDEARRLGLKRVQLEVITTNEPAYRLYQSVGFKRLRHLAVLFTGDTPRAIDGHIPDGITLQRAAPGSVMEHIPRLAATTPAWQHDRESMLVILNRTEGLVATRLDGSAAGACLWAGDDDQGALLALATRSEKVGAALLGAVRRRLPTARLNFLNVPDDDPMLPVLLDAGFSELIGQHEMVLELA
jgi:GNAT superfamily N-acetyltransferase